MARDREPMTDDEFEALKEAMDDQRDKLRETLAADSGDEPDDDCAGAEQTDDGDGDR